MRSARLFYTISERARRITESYFLLNSTLHFSYTHLVCRTAITGTHTHTHTFCHLISWLTLIILSRVKELNFRLSPNILNFIMTVKSSCHGNRDSRHRRSRLKKLPFSHVREGSGRFNIQEGKHVNVKREDTFCVHAFFASFVCFCSQANRTTETTWAIPSMLTTVCWTPRPMSAGRNPRPTPTETTGTVRLLRSTHRTELLCHSVKHLHSLLGLIWPLLFFCFQCTVISKWKLWRRGVHIHRDGCQNCHSE